MSLIDEVRTCCLRLAKEDDHWIDLFRLHGLDITAEQFPHELQKDLHVDRSFPGFQDFAAEGHHAIEPGKPCQSLLYHALASPNVLSAPSRNGGKRELRAFPLLRDLEVIENYIFAARKASVGDLLAIDSKANLSIAVFAYEYRPAIETVHRKHADLCFSRTGLARIGNQEEFYDKQLRGFSPFGTERNQIRALPARYGAFVAIQKNGNKASIGPMRFRERDDDQDSEELKKSDSERLFWVPIHKLFDGEECIVGRTLRVDLHAKHRNEKLRRVHLFFLNNGQDAGWRGDDLQKEPFVIEDGIASLSEHLPHAREQYGNGVVIPRATDLVTEAKTKDGKELVTFQVPRNSEALNASLRLPDHDNARSAPEFVHARHKMVRGERVDLNEFVDVNQVVKRGGYTALHYVDHTADGYVEAKCAALAHEFPRNVPAYSLVTGPDFFCMVSQADLLEWTQRSLPTKYRETIWKVLPETLADNRIPPNLQFPGANFRQEDVTVTAIVSMPGAQRIQTSLIENETPRHDALPDGAAGVFAPGWDVSTDRLGKVDHLAAYGLGSPFLEDAKLCAALSTFWPAVAPDSTRTFPPREGWPTVAPLTDEEIGMTGVPSWDGVIGPRLVSDSMVEYPDFDRTDYVQNGLDRKLSLDALGRVNNTEYRRRVLTMARVYDGLHIDKPEKEDANSAGTKKAKWAVLSFQIVNRPNEDHECAQALDQTGKKEFDGPVYRIQIFQHQTLKRAPEDKRPTVQVEVEQMYLVLCDSSGMLKRKIFPKGEDQPWSLVDA